MSEMNCTARCVMCGIIMQNVGHGRKYCDDCRKIHKHQLQAEWGKKRASKNYIPRAIANGMNQSVSETLKARAEKRATTSDELLREKCRVADWLGISYGNLMLKGPEKVEELTRQYYEAMKTA